MRRQLLVGLLVGVVGLSGVGLVVWGVRTGLLSPHGRARWFLVRAERAIQHNQPREAQAILEELVGKFPDSPWTDKALLELGQLYERQQQPAEARTMYRLLLERFPSSAVVWQAQRQLGLVNVALLFSQAPTELDTTCDVKAGETLGKIAAANHTTVEFLRRANHLTNDGIHPGQKLMAPKGHASIVVDKSQNQLLLTMDNQFLKMYPVATGENSSTPVGTFKIVNKVTNPVWFRQGAAVPPNSPENILGTRWMGQDKAGYGIHGSVDPSGIGKQITAGRVRLNNPDVEELFALAPVGTDVTIVD